VVIEAGLVVGIRRYVRFVRPSHSARWVLNPYLPALLVVSVLLAFRVAKIAYEETYPCVVDDSMYCDFDSTQYHYLFGWEF